MNKTQLSIGQCAALACLLEVNAPKPGNVNRGADFDDATLNDFAASAVAIGGSLGFLSRAKADGDTASWEDVPGDQGRVGEAVLRCVEATQRVARTNTNLGAILLLAPLACVPRDEQLRGGVAKVLNSLNADDARDVYQAIRLAAPGGLGEVDRFDVSGEPPASLLEAMRAAAERDVVAAQYATNFSTVFDDVAPKIVAGREANLSLPLAIVHTQIQLLAERGDSLIARKCGGDVSAQCRARAERVLDCGRPPEENYQRALRDFDFWLRSDGRRRNPGATADLIAAGLFVCLRDGLIAPPLG